MTTEDQIRQLLIDAVPPSMAPRDRIRAVEQRVRRERLRRARVSAATGVMLVAMTMGTLVVLKPGLTGCSDSVAYGQAVREGHYSSQNISGQEKELRKGTATLSVLGVIAMLGGCTSSNSPDVAGPAQTSASPSGPAPATTDPMATDLVTKSDAEALLGGFLIACEDPATYPLAGQGVPCAKEDRGRVYEVDGHYCADDWHVISSQLVDTEANLQNYEPQQSIDGVMLQGATRTPIRPIESAYSQQTFGGQYYYIQIGLIVSPQQLSPGEHSLRQFATDGSVIFDRQIPFTIDPSGTGVCAGEQDS